MPNMTKIRKNRGFTDQQALIQEQLPNIQDKLLHKDVSL